MKQWLIFLLVVLLVLDTSFSFYHYSKAPLDGDLPAIVLPTDWYGQVLKDPLGISAVFEGKKYAGTNRYFVHAEMYAYFNYVPQALQTFLPPIESLYIACGIVKILVQLLLMFLIAKIATREKKFFSSSVLLVMVLVMPLFQTTGFEEINIVNGAITYTFFYGLSMVFLLAYLKPFLAEYLYSEDKEHYSYTFFALWIAFALFLAFNGPTIGAAMLISAPLVLLHRAWKRPEANLFQKIFSEIKSHKAILLSILFLFSLYSLYLGTKNIESEGHVLPLIERYQRLPTGLFKWLTQHIGVPLLLFALISNYHLLKRYPNQTATKIRSMMLWALFLSSLYILLLPLGGYREYRYYIIRFDSVIPITTALITLYGISSYALLQSLPFSIKRFYIGAIALVSLVYSLAELDKKEDNTCEKAALTNLQAWKGEDVYIMEEDCNVLCWQRQTMWEYTGHISDMLHRWNITNRKVKYQQKIR